MDTRDGVRSLKTLGTRHVYRGPRLRVRLDELENDRGQRVEYYTVERPCDAVAAVAVTDADEILLVEQYRHPLARSVLDLPGGGIDGDEAAEEAVKREILEETGYRAGATRYLGTFYTDPSQSAHKIHLYEASQLALVGRALPEPASAIRVVAMPLADLANTAGDFDGCGILSSWSQLGIFYYLHACGGGADGGR